MRSRLKSSCTKREERGLGSLEEVQQPTEAFVCLFSYDIESKLHIINIICLNWFRRRHIWDARQFKNPQNINQSLYMLKKKN